MTVKRIVHFVPCILTLMVLVGCRVDSEFWINKTGSGHGRLTVSGVPGLTKEQLKYELTKDPNGPDVVSVEEKENGIYVAKIKWNDFQKMFGQNNLTQNSDGTIVMNFGNLDMPGLMTVHVDGNIDKKRTTGSIKSSDTVVFSGGLAVLYYKPGQGVGSFLKWGAIALAVLLLIAGSAMAALKMNKKKPKAISASAQGRASRFCVHCGAAVEPDAVFCTECGKSLR